MNTSRQEILIKIPYFFIRNEGKRKSFPHQFIAATRDYEKVKTST